ncbi:kinetochore protein NUF2-like protein [Achlya hypogyna]|uniref:Kinetochore protein NUF2-like protein n=1 Tax=Achlya hypogyna TaxID=1202772 RepID=A0A1V9ZHY0_ACHHY|nr:kinetochore protein NUF2-like protein [Achlya hypogyna]
MSQQPKLAYSFPMLKMSEIFQHLKGMNIHFAEDDIRNCDPSAVRRVIEDFIFIVMGIGKDELCQPALSGLSMLEYPQLHEDSIPEIAYYRTAWRLMQAAGVYDFGWTDVHKPTLKRVRRLFSAMINFTRFKEERMAFLSEHERKTDDELRLRQEAEDENAALRRQLEEIRAQQAAEAPALQQVMDECVVLEGEINVLNKRQAVLRHENAGLKNQSNQLRDDYASVQFAVLEAIKTTERLQSKIVSSPARFKSEISNIATQVDASKDELDVLDQRSTELDMTYDVFARADKEMNKTIELMHEAEVDTARCKQEKDNVKAQHQQIDDNYNKARHAVAHHARLQKLVQQRREQLEQYKQQASTKLQAAEHALASATRELHQLQDKNKGLEQQIQAKYLATQELQRKMLQEQKESERKLREMEETFLKMEAHVKNYTQGLLSAMERAP